MSRATGNARPAGGLAGAGDQAVGETNTTVAPSTRSRQPRLTALPVEYDGAALTDAERVELRRARADERRSRRARARQHDRRMGGA